MKHLTMKFREIFGSYDYDSKDIHILTQLLDLVMSMMTVIDKDDTHYIQKLATFLKIFSSDFSVDILDEKVNCIDILNDAVIDIIYENQILPIFVHFDQKYEYLDIKEEETNDDKTYYYDTTVKELCTDNDIDDDYIEDNLSPECNISRYVQNKTNIAVDQIIQEICPVITTRIHETNNKGDPNIGDCSKLFYVLKSTAESIRRIYNEILNRRCEDKNEILFELQSIKDSAELALNHPYKEIQKLSQIIYGLCKLITDIIDSDSGPSLTNKSVIELLFETIEDIKYNHLIHR